MAQSDKQCVAKVPASPEASDCSSVDQKSLVSVDSLQLGDTFSAPSEALVATRSAHECAVDDNASGCSTQSFEQQSLTSLDLWGLRHNDFREAKRQSQSRTSFRGTIAGDRGEKPIHRRERTDNAMLKLESLDTSLRSRSSAPDRLVKRPSSPSTSQQPPALYNISSLRTLTNPRVLKIHGSSLKSLAKCVESLSAFMHDESRDNWEAANSHYRKAVRTAAHVRMWAEHFKPVLPEGQTPCTDLSISAGEAVLPGWYSRWSMARTKDARCRRRRLLAKEGMQRARFLHKKQTAMHNSMWIELTTLTIASARAFQRIELDALRKRSSDGYSHASPPGSRDNLSAVRRDGSSVDTWLNARPASRRVRSLETTCGKDEPAQYRKRKMRAR